MRTNKSYGKRIRVTKNGKLMVRKAGINHFNARKSRSKQLGAKRGGEFMLKTKSKARYMPK